MDNSQAIEEYRSRVTADLSLMDGFVKDLDLDFVRKTYLDLEKIQDFLYESICYLHQAYGLHADKDGYTAQYYSSRSIYFYDFCQIFDELESEVRKTQLIELFDFYNNKESAYDKLQIIKRIKKNASEYLNEDDINKIVLSKDLLSPYYADCLSNLDRIQLLYLNLQVQFKLICDAKD